MIHDDLKNYREFLRAMNLGAYQKMVDAELKDYYAELNKRGEKWAEARRREEEVERIRESGGVPKEDIPFITVFYGLIGVLVWWLIWS